LLGDFTQPLVFAIISVTLGSFQFGYHIGCVNAPGAIITDWIITSHKELFNVTLDKPTADLTWSSIVAVFGVGGAIGGLLSAFLADRCGRRGGLLYTNVFAFLAAVLMGGTKIIGVYWTLLLGRLFIGIYAGKRFSCLTVLIPMYLTEVPPTNLRGMIASLHQLLITIGILVSQIFGLPYIFGTQERWPFIFGFTAIPALLQVMTLPIIPESPRFTLCVKGNIAQGTKDLERLRGTANVTAEVDMMREEANAGKDERLSLADMFRGNLRWPMTIAMLLMVCQQLSGINAVMFYSTVIFKQAGLSEQGAVYATIGVGVVNVLMTIISVWLVDHPSAGRRTLLLWGMVGMWISTLLLVVCISMSMKGALWASYGAIVFIMLFVISFAAGAGSIPWFFVSEIFFSNARANANSIATLTNWLSNVVVGLTFLPINNIIHQYSFLVFTVLLTLFIVFIFKYIPETKGKTTEQIVAELHKKY
uniref:MFS domain-containing protein n=1 Tax=Angiostrongylus cantonensis TaxID=6313 RepID=A0A0K0DPE5_ANGCA